VVKLLTTSDKDTKVQAKELIARTESLIDQIAHRSTEVAGMIASHLNDVEAALHGGTDVAGDLDALHTDTRTYYDVFFGFADAA
jgi:hypothetical protein